MTQHSYSGKDEIPVIPLISSNTYELSPSSTLPTKILYQEHRIAVMLNIVSLVRECCMKKRVSSHR